MENTLSERSIRFYQRISNGLLEGNPAEPLQALRALKHRYGKVSKSTWFTYRAAMLFAVQEHGGEVAAQSLTDMLETLGGKHGPKVNYARQVPPYVLAAIENALLDNGAPKAIVMALMFRATTLTGLRPSEWSKSRREGSNLIVTNAKFRKGKSGNGRKRTLSLQLDQLTEHDLSTIDQTIANARTINWETQSGDYLRYLRQVRKLLVQTKIIPPRFSNIRLYEARHQFAANAKNSLSLIDGEVAAAMGHRRRETAIRSYGKRRHASSTSAVKPDASSVNAVETRTALATGISADAKVPKIKRLNAPVQLPANE